MGKPDVGENKPFSALQLLLQDRTLPKQPLFCGIPSSTLTHVDSELYRKRRQSPPQPEPPAKCSQPIPQRRVRVPLAEKHVDFDPTFPAEFSGAPAEIVKQIENSNYKWGPLLQSLSNIRSETNSLRHLVSVGRRNIEKDLKIIMLCFAESNYAVLASQSRDASSVSLDIAECEKGNLRISFISSIFHSLGRYLSS